NDDSFNSPEGGVCMVLTHPPASNLAAAVSERGAKVVLDQFRAQHPEYFCCATKWVRDNPAARLRPAQNPPVTSPAQITEIDPFVLPASPNLAVDLAVQITRVDLDFPPGVG